MTEAERQTLFSSCTKFLNGHYPLTVREQFERLASAVEPSEKADVYGGGKLIEDFEKEVAALLGKPSAVFMPSGTMAQVIAMRIRCDRAKSRTSAKASTIALYPTSHLELHEQKSYRELHGLQSVPVGEYEKQLSLADLESSSEEFSAVIVELPQRESGGILPEWSELVAMSDFCRSRKIAFHLDGARLWEAGPYFRKSYAEICALFDSVYVSFYKGLGGITGAMLLGDADFIAESKIWQRRHGGNLYRLYPYVVSARECLTMRLPKMAAYHEKAKEIAAVLNEIPGIKVIPEIPQTNMMHLHFDKSASTLEESFIEIARDEKVGLFFKLQPKELGSKAELSVGDAALDLETSVIKKLFSRALSR